MGSCGSEIVRLIISICFIPILIWAAFDVVDFIVVVIKKEYLDEEE